MPILYRSAQSGSKRLKPAEIQQQFKNKKKPTHHSVWGTGSILELGERQIKMSPKEWVSRGRGDRVNMNNVVNWRKVKRGAVKNPPTMQETWVRFLGGEDPAGGGHCKPLQCSCLGNPKDKGAWGLQSTAQPRVGHSLSD